MTPAKAIIDLKAFRNNIEVIREILPDNRIILPVKANAYGHDSLIIAKEAMKVGVEYLAVSRVDEGVFLRENGIDAKIIDLGIEFDSNIKTAIENDIELSVSFFTNLKEINDSAESMNKKIPIHLKVDTGMVRLGMPSDDIESAARYIKSSNNLEFKSFYTHFAKSDSDLDYTNYQLKQFLYIKKDLEEKRLVPEFYHTHNSAAIIRRVPTDKTFYIRPGIIAYGYSSYVNMDKNDVLGLIPVMTLESKVINIKKIKKGTGISYNHKYVAEKDTFIATIALGYGDGIQRNLTNRLIVKINGVSYKQVGTITMDLMMIEVDSRVKIGDTVYVFGNKEHCHYDALDLANLTETISYEITTSIIGRVERVGKNWLF